MLENTTCNYLVFVLKKVRSISKVLDKLVSFWLTNQPAEHSINRKWHASKWKVNQCVWPPFVWTLLLSVCEGGWKISPVHSCPYALWLHHDHPRHVQSGQTGREWQLPTITQQVTHSLSVDLFTLVHTLLVNVVWFRMCFLCHLANCPCLFNHVYQNSLVAWVPSV